MNTLADSNDPQPGQLEPGHFEIDALLDGELVDKDALRSALDDPAARDYLVEALILRQLARDMEPVRFAIPGSPRGRLLRGTRWLAASVILVVGASVGYVYGHGSRAQAAAPGLVEVVLDNRPAPRRRNPHVSSASSPV